MEWAKPLSAAPMSGLVPVGVGRGGADLVGGADGEAVGAAEGGVGDAGLERDDAVGVDQAAAGGGIDGGEDGAGGDVLDVAGDVAQDVRAEDVVAVGKGDRAGDVGADGPRSDGRVAGNDAVVQLQDYATVQEQPAASSRVAIVLQPIRLVARNRCVPDRERTTSTENSGATAGETMRRHIADQSGVGDRNLAVEGEQPTAADTRVVRDQGAGNADFVAAGRPNPGTARIDGGVAGDHAIFDGQAAVALHGHRSANAAIAGVVGQEAVADQDLGGGTGGDRPAAEAGHGVGPGDVVADKIGPDDRELRAAGGVDPAAAGKLADLVAAHPAVADGAVRDAQAPGAGWRPLPSWALPSVRVRSRSCTSEAMPSIRTSLLLSPPLRVTLLPSPS